jgi:hypothetical protein
VRVVIAGSRSVDPSLDDIDRAVATLGLTVTEVVSGCARGADRSGELWAFARDIPLKRFPAQWELHGSKLAGKFRNREMAIYADAAIVFWDGMSSGAADMVCRMVARRKPVLVVPLRPRAAPSPGHRGVKL